MRKLLIAFVLVCGTAGVVVGAHAAQADADAVALCVGCTAASQFQAAAKQAVGRAFNGTRKVLVVNPDTALSKWVIVTNTPPGQEPLSVSSPSPVQTGVAVALESRPFANIFVAGDGHASVSTPGSESARSYDLTQAQKLGVTAMVQLTEDIRHSTGLIQISILRTFISDRARKREFCGAGSGSSGLAGNIVYQ